MVFKYSTYGQETLTEFAEEYLAKEFNQEECTTLTMVDLSEQTAGKVLPFPASDSLPDNISDVPSLASDKGSSVEHQSGVDSSLARYFSSISKYRLLSEEEEKELAIDIKEAEKMLMSVIMQWNKLFKKDFIRSIPAKHMKEVRKRISQANGTFPLFDDFITLESERKRLLLTQKRLTQNATAYEKIEEELYKVESALSKTIAQTNLSKSAVNILIKQVKSLSNGHRKTKRQQQVELELASMLRKISHYLDEIRTVKNGLVQANLRIVISMAKKHTYHGIPFSDLIQEGNLGLIRATDTYDYRKGHRFITYASWWIKQAVLRVIDCHSRTIRTPIYLREKINKIKKVSNQLQVECKRKPTLHEIAETTNISLETIEKVKQSFKESLSLDSFIEENGEKAINPPSAHTDNAIIQQTLFSDLNQRIHSSLSALPQRERDIVKLRFGIGESHNHSLEEIGKHFNLSRERIRQILEEALKKLRHPRSLNKLKDFIEPN
jgi:RNA polymerase primary sigma factor